MGILNISSCLLVLFNTLLLLLITQNHLCISLSKIGGYMPCMLGTCLRRRLMRVWVPSMYGMPILIYNRTNHRRLVFLTATRGNGVTDYYTAVTGTVMCLNEIWENCEDMKRSNFPESKRKINKGLAGWRSLLGFSAWSFWRCQGVAKCNYFCSSHPEESNSAPKFDSKVHFALSLPYINLPDNQSLVRLVKVRLPVLSSTKCNTHKMVYSTF